MTLYGFEQLAKAWFGKFVKVIIDLRFKQVERDCILFIKQLENQEDIALLIYVDDIIVIGDDEKEKQILKQYMAEEFKIKNFVSLCILWELKSFTQSLIFLFRSRNTFMTY